MGLIGLVGFISFGLISLVGISGFSLIGLSGFGLIGLRGINGLILQISLVGLVGLSGFGLIRLVGISGFDLVGLDSLFSAIISAAVFSVVVTTHAETTKLTSATKIASKAILYYSDAPLHHVYSLMREKM